MAALASVGEDPVEVRRTGRLLESGKKKGMLNTQALEQMAARLQWFVEQGADIDPRESSYDGTPIGWAAHFDKIEMVRFLSRYSRDIWTLCFSGYVDRVREILAEDPDRSKLVDRNGVTPLWWLPDDEGAAMQIVELLLAAGADPSANSSDGRTAANWARRRGMRDVAARLETAMASSRMP